MTEEWINGENRYDNNRKSNKWGMVFEALFDRYSAREGWISKEAPFRWNTTKHIDRLVQFKEDGRTCYIQVKMPKKAIQHHEIVDGKDKYTSTFPIELHNPYESTTRYNGWLYNGQSHFIAFAYTKKYFDKKRWQADPFKFLDFDTHDIRPSFITVNRLDLIKLIDKIKVEKGLEDPTDRIRGELRPYEFYQRRDFELLFCIPYHEIKSIAKFKLTSKRLVRL